MAKSGYDPRNYITLTAMYDVYNTAITPEPLSAVLLVVGSTILLRRRRNLTPVP
jgi:hypothetical protein